jgi:hypothetical protein
MKFIIVSEETIYSGIFDKKWRTFEHGKIKCKCDYGYS